MVGGAGADDSTRGACQACGAGGGGGEAGGEVLLFSGIFG